MELNSNNYYEVEKEIDFSDLFKHLLMSWKMIVIFAVIGAILGNGVGIYGSVKQIKEKKNEVVLTQAEKEELAAKAAEDAIKKAKKSLSQREIDETERAIMLYRSAQEKYNKELEYMDNSILMSLDANNVATIKMQYAVDNHYSVEYPVIDKKDNTSLIAQSICSMIVDEELVQNLADSMEFEGASNYIEELIKVDWSNGTVSITILLADKVYSDDVMQKVNERVLKISKELRGIYGEFDVNKIDFSCKYQVDTEVLDKQTSQLASLNSMKKTMLEQTSGLSDNQKEYYAAILDESNKYDIDSLDEEMDGSGIQDNIEWIHLKYLLLGLLVGVFLICGFKMLFYIVSDSLKTKEDLERYFNLALLGEVSLGGKDKLEQLQILTTTIQLKAKSCNIHKLYLATTSEGAEMASLLEELKTSLGDSVEVIKCGTKLHSNAAALVEMTEMDGVILVEQKGKSRIRNMLVALGKCNSCNMTILGGAWVK